MASAGLPNVVSCTSDTRPLTHLQALMEQAGQFANSPFADPSKNPAVGEAMSQTADQLGNNAEEETIPTTEGG